MRGSDDGVMDVGCHEPKKVLIEHKESESILILVSCAHDNRILTTHHSCFPQNNKRLDFFLEKT